MLALKNIIREKIMKKLLVRFLKYLTKNEEQAEIFQPDPQQGKEEDQPEAQIIPPIVIEESKQQESIPKIEVGETKLIAESKKKAKEPKKTRGKKQKEGDIVTIDPRDIRDVMEFMGVPLVSIYKKRTSPMIYDNHDGSIKVKITPLTGHYLASIYDWDIIMYVASKIQEVINSNKDIPPRTIVIPRHKLLKELHRHDGKKQKEDLEESLKRLQSTVIETTIWNEDCRYKSGFSFLDNWGYTERKDVKEFRITLSEWFYDGACKKGALLKTDPAYFKITSGIKKFLYRTARKHVGNQNQWDFLVETIYEKSGSEREFKKFKHDLKKAVSDNDLPSYFMDWVEKDGKTYVRFINARKEIKKILSEPSTQPSLPFL
jgi:plasmid replication initiation protein